MPGYLRAVTVQEKHVDEELAIKMQGVAQRAWTSSMKNTRSREEISRAFDPTNPVLVAAALKQYKEVAKKGRLIVVTSSFSSLILGYSLSHNDVSPYGNNPSDLINRNLKRVMSISNHKLGTTFPDRVYAFEKHLVADPDAPRGVGSLALKASLSGFHPDQITTAYIDDENDDTAEYAYELGYRWDGNDPVEIQRFGEDNEPTLQFRHAAPVSLVLDRIDSILYPVQ
jgi:hypothetical protein